MLLNRQNEIAKKLLPLLKDIDPNGYQDILSMDLASKTEDEVISELSEKLADLSFVDSLLAYLNTVPTKYDLTVAQKRTLFPFLQKIKEVRDEVDLTALFGEKSYSVNKTPCKGRYNNQHDFQIVFESGRRLFICAGARNYAKRLTEHLDAIRHFRANQERNTARFRHALLPKCSVLQDISVEINAMNKDLNLYATLRLALTDGTEIIHRSSQLHYFLTGKISDWCNFDAVCFSLMNGYKLNAPEENLL